MTSIIDYSVWNYVNNKYKKYTTEENKYKDLVYFIDLKEEKSLDKELYTGIIIKDLGQFVLVKNHGIHKINKNLCFKSKERAEMLFKLISVDHIRILQTPVH